MTVSDGEIYKTEYCSHYTVNTLQVIWPCHRVYSNLRFFKNWLHQTKVEKQLEDLSSCCVVFSVYLLSFVFECWHSIIIIVRCGFKHRIGIESRPAHGSVIIWYNDNLLRQRARWYWHSILGLVMFIYSGGVVTITITVNTNTCHRYLLIILKILRNWCDGGGGGGGGGSRGKSHWECYFPIMRSNIPDHVRK